MDTNGDIYRVLPECVEETVTKAPESVAFTKKRKVEVYNLSWHRLEVRTSAGRKF